MKPKNDLIRVVKSPTGETSKAEISTDDTGKKPGRGAYVCRDINCFNRIIKSKALSRAFKMQVPENIITEITEILEQSENIINAP
jgi:predicted RNA-binding protein YlxR (DUF448 family)